MDPVPGTPVAEDVAVLRARAEADENTATSKCTDPAGDAVDRDRFHRHQAVVDFAFRDLNMAADSGASSPATPRHGAHMIRWAAIVALKVAT
jgi:hypothetical protein